MSLLLSSGAKVFAIQGPPGLTWGYYGQPSLPERLRAAMGECNTLRHRFPPELLWEQRAVDLYERKGATE